LYADCCDEFFFGLGSHIPKTFWRKQLPLLKFYIEVVLRKPLVMRLEWEIGVKTGFEKSVGRAGKHLQKHLEPEVWREFEYTYAGADYDSIYESFLTFYRLFKRTAESVGQHYGYRFPAENGKRALDFLEHVRYLPEDARSIF
jgi:aminoglycoside 6-adenylyltransferase